MKPIDFSLVYTWLLGFGWRQKSLYKLESCQLQLKCNSFFPSYAMGIFLINVIKVCIVIFIFIILHHIISHAHVMTYDIVILSQIFNLFIGYVYKEEICIGVGFGNKILIQTWPNVWVTCRILCVHFMDMHVK
jgi:hypothetical protein